MFRRASISLIELIGVFILIACGSVALFWNLLARPDAIAHFSDAIHVWYFFKTFTVNALRDYNELPLWNPLIYSGVPFVGNPQSTLFYPPFFLFYVIPVHYAISLLFVIHFAFAGCGMYLFARLRRLSFPAAILSVIIFVLNYKVMGHIFAGHLTQTCAWAYFPWILIAIEYYVCTRKVRAMLFVALSYAFLFLAGQMQIFYYQVVIGLVYLLCMIGYHNKSAAVGILFGYAICAIMAVLFVAISLLPVLELMDHFQRSGGTNFSFASIFSLRWKDFLSLVVPHMFVIPEHGANLDNQFFWERTMYTGIVPLVLLLISYRRREWMHTGFFVTLLIFSVLFALGGRTPFFALMYKFVPGVGYFRCPSRMLLFAGFSVAILAGFAFQNILDDRYFSKIRPLYRISLLLALILIAVHELVFYRYDTLIPNASHAMTYLLIFALFLFMWHRGYTNRLMLSLAVIGVTAYDLGSLGYPLIKSIELTEIFPKSGLYSGIINDPTTFRVYDAAGAFPQYYGALTGVQQVGGDEPVMLETYRHYLDKIDSGQLLQEPDNDAQIYHADAAAMMFPVADFTHEVNWLYLHLLNVKYLMTTYPVDEPFLIREDSRTLDRSTTRFLDGVYPIVSKIGGILHPKTYLYRNSSVLPRGFLLSAQGVSVDEAMDKFLNHTRRDVQPAPVEYYEPNTVVFHTKSDEITYLVTSELYYPGWIVYIDGQQGKVMPVMDTFRAVELTPGSHVVEFVYQPESFRRGKLITFGWLILCGLLVLIRAFQSKNTKKELLLPFFLIFLHGFF